MSQSSLTNPVGLVWRNVTYDIPLANKDRKLRLKLSGDPEKAKHDKSPESGTRRILHDINGRVDHGEIVGILGASGSGKTTLLNVLSGRLSNTGDATGTVTYQGARRRSTRWKRTIAFVEQDDALFARLTVRETIAYAAKLRLPNNEFDKEAKRKRVQDTIDMLRLDECENGKVGSGTERGISGGERKRTSIGVELVSNASLLFLDEPTSGLDSYAASRLVSNLRDVVQQRNLACLMTIHQPSWAMFCTLDRVVLLAKGSVYYDGPPKDTIQYFDKLGHKVPEGVNPADHFISLAENADRDEAGKARIQNLIDEWRKVSSEGSLEATPKDTLVTEKSTNQWPTPWIAELYVLFQRAAHDQMRDRGLWIGSVGQTLIFLIIIGFAFFRLGTDQAAVLAKIGVLFIIPINAAFSAQAPVLASFALQRAILIRERSSALYRCSSFFLAKVFLEVPIGIIMRIPYLIIVYFMIGLQPTAGKLFIFLGINCLHLLNSTCLGLAIAAVSPTVNIANIISPVVSVIFLFFGGNLLPKPPPWFIWLKYISPLNYTYSALATNEFAGQRLTCDGGGQAQCYSSGDDVLRAYNLRVFTIGEDAGFLVALTALFLVLGYIGLNLSTRPKLRII